MLIGELGFEGELVPDGFERTARVDGGNVLRDNGFDMITKFEVTNYKVKVA